MNGVRMLPAGEQGLVLEFGSSINEEINARVHQTARLVTERLSDRVIEVVPTYRSLLVYFNPLVMTRDMLISEIEDLLTCLEGPGSQSSSARVVYIPVCYGGEFGPDIDFVAQHNNLSVDEVIKIHTGTPYLVYMLGFTPGFPYLGGMSERIAAPRLDKPRTKIPAGSVGIAGSQTGFYPIESPGGWRLIGQTPIKGFDKDADNPFPLDAGDYLQFQAVTPEEFYNIKQQVNNGTYRTITKQISRGGVR